MIRITARSMVCETWPRMSTSAVKAAQATVFAPIRCARKIATMIDAMHSNSSTMRGPGVRNVLIASRARSWNESAVVILAPCPGSAAGQKRIQ
jgi:hypothetical protein